MLHLIPKPLHRWLYRVAFELRGHWRRWSKLPTLGVALIGRNDAGSVLLVRHAYGSGRWTLPGGGRGRREDPEACARREIREELGCSLAEVELVEIVEQSIQGAPNTGHIFTALVVGEPVADQREIVEARWFAPTSLPEDMVGLSRRRLEAWLER